MNFAPKGANAKGMALVTINIRLLRSFARKFLSELVRPPSQFQPILEQRRYLQPNLQPLGYLGLLTADRLVQFTTFPHRLCPLAGIGGQGPQLSKSCPVIVPLKLLP